MFAFLESLLFSKEVIFPHQIQGVNSFYPPRGLAKNN